MSQFSNKTNQDLLKSIRDDKEALRAFRFGLSGSKTRNVAEGRKLRRQVARVATELKNRTLSL